MKFLNAKEAAQYLHISYATFLRIRRLPDAPKYFKPAGRKVLYTAEDLDNWIMKKAVEMGTETEKVEQ